MSDKAEATRICGYCRTNTHELCKPVIRWYENVWYCNCECQKSKGEEE